MHFALFILICIYEERESAWGFRLPWIVVDGTMTVITIKRQLCKRTKHKCLLNYLTQDKTKHRKKPTHKIYLYLYACKESFAYSFPLKLLAESLLRCFVLLEWNVTSIFHIEPLWFFVCVQFIDMNAKCCCCCWFFFRFEHFNGFIAWANAIVDFWECIFFWGEVFSVVFWLFLWNRTAKHCFFFVVLSFLLNRKKTFYRYL